MKRTKLRNNFLKNRAGEKKIHGKKIHQAKKLLCITIKKSKAQLFNGDNEKNITDNRKLWKTFKAMLSSKNNRNKKIISTGNEKILSNDNKIAEVLNNFFSDIIKALVISPNCFF